MSDSTEAFQNKINNIKNILFVMVLTVALIFVGTVIVAVTSNTFITEVIIIRIINMGIVIAMYFVALKGIGLFEQKYFNS